VEENEHRCSAWWDEVPAVAGVGSIQKRQQSAPPYYVFSSGPYPSFQSPLLLPSHKSDPPPLALQPLYHTASSPSSLSWFSRAGTVYCEPEDLSAAGSSLSARSALIENNFFSLSRSFFSPRVFPNLEDSRSKAKRASEIGLFGHS